MKKSLAEVIQQDDVRSELLFHEGCTAYYAGHREEAIKLFEQSSKLCPENQNAKDALERLKK